MRESADRAQRFIDNINQRFDHPVDNNSAIPTGNEYSGELNVELGEIDLSDIAKLRKQESIENVARDIDAEIMDDIYASVRNNSSRVNNGYNEFRALKALEKEINPQMITGAKPETVEEWYEDFRNAGLTYPDEDEEILTSEGQVFAEEAYHFMERVGKDEDDEQAEQYLGNLFNSLSRRSRNQGNRLYGFLLMAETDKSMSEIGEEAGTTERSAYNWANEWLTSGEAENNTFSLLRGEPSDRELTDIGRAAYDMIGNQYRRMDIASEMKAAMIERLNQNRPEGEPAPYVPGNQEMVASYLSDPTVAEQYMEQ